MTEVGRRTGRPAQLSVRTTTRPDGHRERYFTIFMDNDEYPSNLLLRHRFEPGRSFQKVSKRLSNAGPLRPSELYALNSGRHRLRAATPPDRVAELCDRTVLGFATKMRKSRPPFR
jgi:hypothetical protein